MAFNEVEWTIDYDLKTITNLDSDLGTGLPSNKGTDGSVGTVLSFFQWCASVFANSSQMDDDYAFVSDTPTVYRFVNDWSFGRDASDYKYLSGGSIETADNSILYSNLYSIGSQENGTQLYMLQADSQITPWWITGNIDILVEVKRDGQWIYSLDTADVSTAGGVWMYAREFGDLYDHNFATLSGGGATPIGINTALDSGNRSGEVSLEVDPGGANSMIPGNFLLGGTTNAVGKIISIVSNDVLVTAIREGQFTGTESLIEYSDRELQTATGESTNLVVDTSIVAGYTDISTGFATINRDLNNGDGLQPYDAEIDCATKTLVQTYEWMKFVTRYGSEGATYTVNDDDGQEYRSAAEDSGGGATSGGPYTDVKVAPFGTLAGTTMYGARGIWFSNYDSADFVLIDAQGDSQSPPNYQKVVCSHDDLIGTQIFVSEITGAGGTIIKDQYAVTDAAVTYINVSATINSNKTPTNGILRIGDNQYTYTSFDASSFSISTDASGEAIDSSLYVPLLDVAADATIEQSQNLIYTTPIDVRTRVRKYGFKPYTADTQFGATGLTFSPILTSDPQAT